MFRHTLRPDEPTRTAQLVRLAIWVLYVLRLRRTYYDVFWAAHTRDPQSGRMYWGPTVVLIRRYRRRMKWLPTPEPDAPGWIRALRPSA